MSLISSISAVHPGPAPLLEHYSHVSSEKLRYGDTDRQGHVNNAVFVTFLESGRVDILLNGETDLCGPDGAFVLARLVLDYRKEMNWPGEIEIGTNVVSIGRSSVRMAQALFQNGDCVATAETIAVLTDVTTRRSKPFSDEARAFLQSKGPVAPAGE
jgi:acyl-CoA thioester hydrolase